MSVEQVDSTVCGVVRAVHGRQAEVMVEASGCGRCHEAGGCGGHNLARMFADSTAPRTWRVDNALGVAVGERVTIAIAAGHVRRAANLAYGIPLLAAIAGALAGNAWLGDAGAIGGALLALAAAVLHLRRRAQALVDDPASAPRIISRS
jgi:sigma-E factor negative regulatory protein RseC